jgi:hypothetical protein
MKVRLRDAAQPCCEVATFITYGNPEVMIKEKLALGGLPAAKLTPDGNGITSGLRNAGEQRRLTGVARLAWGSWRASG